jgi:hypothetical protein
MKEDVMRFKRYLVGELFWELEQHPPVAEGFAGIRPTEVEVVTFRGYHELRVRIQGQVFDVNLSWQKDVPPRVQRVPDVAG